MSEIGRLSMPLSRTHIKMKPGQPWPSSSMERAEFIARGRLMDPPLSSWKYESGFLTIFHAGKSYELGYFKLHEDARNAALAFRKARRMSQPKRVVRRLRGSRTPHSLQGGDLR